MQAQRITHGLVLILGAIVLAVLVQPIGSRPFYWVPLVTGLTYLLAAAVGGRTAALWAPGLVVTTWGIAVILILGRTVDVDFAAATVTALGAGATLAVLLQRAGFAVSALGIALSVLLAGGFELLDAVGPALFGKGWAYAILLGGWGLWELRLVRTHNAPDRDPAVAPTTAPTRTGGW